MARASTSSDFRRVLAFALGGAGFALALPATVLAWGNSSTEAASYRALPAFAQFTPAGLDPLLVHRAEAIARAKGLNFTPAGATDRRNKPMTVAVRVDSDVAKAVNVGRSAITLAGQNMSGRTATTVAIAPTRYDLGTARGYQSFAQPAASPARLALGTRKPVVDDVPMADLSTYGRPAEPAGKPSRFSSRVALETDEGTPGRTPRTIEALGEQSVDVSGSYRVLRNLNVTAGVRLSQDRDRLAPLTDADEDAKSVYVGTQFKF